MPTLLRFRNFRIVIFVDDHAPAHVHVMVRVFAPRSIDKMLEGRFGNDRWEAAWAEAHPVHRAA